MIANKEMSMTNNSRGAVSARARVLLTHIARIVRSFDSSNFRSVIFDSAAGEFIFSDVGSEKYIVHRADRIISRTVYKTGSFEFEKFGKALSLLGKSFRLDHLIDIGANIGTICIPAVSRRMAKTAIAIEPEPKNFRLLMANIYLNDLGNSIVAHNIALGPRDGETLRLELSEDNGGDHRISVSDSDGKDNEQLRSTLSVRSETFDKIVGRLNPEATLIWMDTQGFEGYILEGAKNALALSIPIVLEFWPYGMKRAGSFDVLKTALARYRFYYNLTEGSPSPVAITPSSFDNLYRSLGEEGSSTDILLV